MNRIEPETVVAAFRELIPQGIEPVQDKFVRYSYDDEGYYRDDPCGVCGLTAVALTRDVLQCTLADLDGRRVPEAAGDFAAALDVSYEYAFGFCQGWDDFTPRTRRDFGHDLVDHPDYQSGRADGAAAWKEVHRSLP